eukprot:1722696-Pleurochrysis_carterae.AAC.1
MGPREQGRAKIGKCNGRISQRTDSVEKEGAQGTWNTAATPPSDKSDAGVYTPPAEPSNLAGG